MLRSSVDAMYPFHKNAFKQFSLTIYSLRPNLLTVRDVYNMLRPPVDTIYPFYKRHLKIISLIYFMVSEINILTKFR